jgi:3-dehydroquinate dehydratase
MKIEVKYDMLSDSYYIDLPDADAVRIAAACQDQASESPDSETELVLVEAIQSYRMRYCVEVPKGKSAYALDSVTMHEATELSQLALEEQIISSRVIDKQEFHRICSEDNDYTGSWSKEYKEDAFITPWEPEESKED